MSQLEMHSRSTFGFPWSLRSAPTSSSFGDPATSFDCGSEVEGGGRTASGVASRSDNRRLLACSALTPSNDSTFGTDLPVDLEEEEEKNDHENQIH